MREERSADVGARGLFGDLLEKFTEIVGPAAGRTTFLYASMQEGIRVGSQEPDLAAALARIDVILGRESAIIQDSSDRVVVAVRKSSLLASGHEVRASVVQGLLEGMLTSRKARKFMLQGNERQGDTFLLTFKRDT